LRNPVTSEDPYRARRVVIDQAYLDLPAVTGVDRARCVHDADPESRREPRPRVHETRKALWQCDGETRTDDPTLAGGQDEVLGGSQIRTGIAWLRIGGWVKVRVKSMQ
jgi:hypothetical protein